MEETFWIGVYPGMTEEKLDYMAQSIHDYFAQKKADAQKENA